jgi:hypothetical protein
MDVSITLFYSNSIVLVYFNVANVHMTTPIVLKQAGIIQISLGGGVDFCGSHNNLNFGTLGSMH